jgi:colicin import membrane protein
MANPPTPAPKPQTPPPAPPKPPNQPPAAAHVPEAHSKDPQEAKLELAESAARDRKVEPPVRTIADEQRERSEEMQKQGVEAWKAAHDSRSADEKQPKVVPGVPQRPVEAHEARR